MADFTFSHAMTKSGRTLTAGMMTASKALADEINAADLKIAWTITRSLHGQTWTTTYDGTKNRTYVTGAAVAQEFETVLDLACKGAKGLRPGQTGDSEAQKKDHNQKVVDGVWGMFSGRAVHRVSDGHSLAYDGGLFGHTVDDLLSAGSAECDTWADFLVHCMFAVGVSASGSHVTAKSPYIKFVVKADDAQGGVHLGDSAFGYHVLVRMDCYSDRLYDPSYGLLTTASGTTPVEQVWEDTRVPPLVNSRNNEIINPVGVDLNIP